MAIEHEQIMINGTSVHVAKAGDSTNRAILFLHGYPENWRSFENVMNKLKDDFYVLAIDLPGIGTSDPIPSNDKRSIATVVNSLAETLKLDNFILAGHDAGGMATYAFLRLFPRRISKAIIMNTAIPGVAPWEEVKRNPYIWHFAFFAVPSLPEILTTGKQRQLFDYFYDTIAASKDSIGESSRKEYTDAYMKPSALKTSFDWYRTFPQDEKDNADKTRVDIPVLCIRGDKDYGKLDQYIEGFKNAGLTNIKGAVIDHCGHFSADEQPDTVAKLIREFASS